MELRRFQRRFLSRALAPGVDLAALSVPRGNGKSTLSAYILEDALTPDGPLGLFEAGAEYLLGAASLEQARNVFRPLRAALEPTGNYRFTDSSTRMGVTHTASNTRLRVMSSNAKAAFGIVGTPLAVLDEPGAWEVNGGELMYDALVTAQGKPESALRLLFAGTLAPAQSGWWHDLIENGSHGSTYVQALVGDRAKWDRWPEIKRVNPLMSVFPESRRKLLQERDAARQDTRLKARFMSYRLNAPTADDSTTLLTTEDWETMTARPTPERVGKPIIGVDLGAGRAWSAAVAVWQSGRVETLAVAPGLPALDVQERRDHVPSGAYSRLAESGRLTIAEGLRVQPSAALVSAILEAWGPSRIIADRFRLPELQDAVKGRMPCSPRMTRWSESSADIRALRRGIADGPLVVSEESRQLVAASLSAALVKNDDAGNVRLIKRGTNNTARDDVAAALVLAAGAFERANARHGAGLALRVVK